MLRWKSLFGPATEKHSSLGLSPEAAAIFERIYRYLEDEDAQNDRLPETLRSTIKGATRCDKIPGSVGIFGRDPRNPIPVNGPLGELIYLSNLLSPSGQMLLFHRLGSINALDVYETVSADAAVWNMLFLDFYHRGKSCLAPDGYHLASGSERKHLFSGANTFVRNFPTGLQDAIRDTHKRLLGQDFGAPKVRFAVEPTAFVRPPEHAALIESILIQLRPH